MMLRMLLVMALGVDLGQCTISSCLLDIVKWIIQMIRQNRGKEVRAAGQVLAAGKSYQWGLNLIKNQNIRKMAQRMSKRLQKEYEAIQKNTHEMKVLLPNNDLTLWHVNFPGAKGTLYEGQNFTLQLRFTNEYPIQSPEVIFIGHIPVHEHIYSNGFICLSILYDLVTRPDCQLHLPLRPLHAQQRSQKGQASQRLRIREKGGWTRPQSFLVELRRRQGLIDQWLHSWKQQLHIGTSSLSIIEPFSKKYFQPVTDGSVFKCFLSFSIAVKISCEFVLGEGAYFAFVEVGLETAAFWESCLAINPLKLFSTDYSTELEAILISLALSCALASKYDQPRAISPKLGGDLSFLVVDNNVKDLPADQALRTRSQLAQPLNQVHSFADVASKAFRAFQDHSIKIDRCYQ